MTKKRTNVKKKSDEALVAEISGAASAEGDVEIKDMPFVATLQNISGGTVRIRAESTPSGNGYTFAPNAIRVIEDGADYQFLKSLTFMGGSGCCGSLPHANNHYFAEVA
jgi:predicted component of type VI protein secretion system